MFAEIRSSAAFKASDILKGGLASKNGAAGLLMNSAGIIVLSVTGIVKQPGLEAIRANGYVS